MATKLTSKGQVTVPKPVRDYLGLRPGSAVTFEIAEDGRVVVARAGAAKRPRTSRFDKLVGVTSLGMTTDEIMLLLRGDPDPVLTGEAAK